MVGRGSCFTNSPFFSNWPLIARIVPQWHTTSVLFQSLSAARRFRNPHTRANKLLSGSSSPEFFGSPGNAHQFGDKEEKSRLGQRLARSLGLLPMSQEKPANSRTQASTRTSKSKRAATIKAVSIARVYGLVIILEIGSEASKFAAFSACFLPTSVKTGSGMPGSNLFFPKWRLNTVCPWRRRIIDHPNFLIVDDCFCLQQTFDHSFPKNPLQ